MTVVASMKNPDIIISPKSTYRQSHTWRRPPWMTREAAVNADQVRQLEMIYSKYKVPVIRRYSANPYQHYDMILFNDLFNNTPAGMVLEAWLDFVMTKEFHPVVLYRDPDAEEKEGDEAEKKEIIRLLTAVDEWYSDKDRDERDTYYDVPIQAKIRAAVMNMEVYARGLIVKEFWPQLPPVTIEGTVYPDIPNVLKLVESQDIGMTEIEEYTGKMAGVWLNNSRPYVPAAEMMYFVDSYHAPSMGSESYGFSKCQRALDPCRLWRRLLAVNLPQWLKVGATGMGMFLMNTTGLPDKEREAIEAALSGIYESAEMAVISPTATSRTSTSRRSS